MSLYQGWKQVSLRDEDLANIYNKNSDIGDSLVENEYLIITDVNGNTIDYFQKRQGHLTHIDFPYFKSNYFSVIKPRNAQQYCAMNMLKNKDIPIKLITGKFGSGKTLLCIGAAMEALQNGQFEKIIFVRNNIQVKDTDALGALPGTELSKMMPYVMPFADHCGGTEGVQLLIESGQLEVIPLGFLRGRSIKNSIIYSMESENLTKEHIQLIMGRVDEGSQLWMDGDFKQRDKGVFERSQGMELMVDRLRGQQEFGYVNLIKTERTKVAAMADLLD